MMLEFEKKHKRGKKTFFFLLVRHGWWAILLGAILIYVAWLIDFGSLNLFTEKILNAHPDWFISTSMLSEWIALLGVGMFIVGYLEANVYYRYYKFMLDEHAVHLQQGLFFIQETTIPYHQITNVHMARPSLYLLLGIAQLDIVTAADKDIDRRENRKKTFLIPVIDTSIARTLSRQLLECSAKSRKGLAVHPDYEDELEEEEEGDENEEDEETIGNTEPEKNIDE